MVPCHCVTSGTPEAKSSRPHAWHAVSCQYACTEHRGNKAKQNMKLQIRMLGVSSNHFKKTSEGQDSKPWLQLWPEQRQDRADLEEVRVMVSHTAEPKLAVPTGHWPGQRGANGCIRAWSEHTVKSCNCPPCPALPLPGALFWGVGCFWSLPEG